jgi:hypothetical protein
MQPHGCGCLFGQAFRVLITKQQNPCHLLGRAIIVALGYPIVDRAQINNRSAFPTYNSPSTPCRWGTAIRTEQRYANRTKICMGKSGRFASQQCLNFLVLKFTKLKGLHFGINSQYLDTILYRCVVRIQRERRRDSHQISDLRIAVLCVSLSLTYKAC